MSQFAPDHKQHLASAAAWSLQLGTNHVAPVPVSLAARVVQMYSSTQRLYRLVLFHAPSERNPIVYATPRRQKNIPNFFPLQRGEHVCVAQQPCSSNPNRVMVTASESVVISRVRIRCYRSRRYAASYEAACARSRLKIAARCQSGHGLLLRIKDVVAETLKGFPMIVEERCKGLTATEPFIMRVSDAGF